MFSSWQMKRPKTGMNTSEVPEHSVHSHLGEAFTYHAFNFAKRFERVKKKVTRTFTPTTGGSML